MRYKELISLNLLIYVLKIQLCEVFIIDTIYLKSLLIVLRMRCPFVKLNERFPKKKKC